MNALAHASSAPVPRPNVVFFLVDDLGWADIGAYGSSFHETPNIDALAASGMKFTQAYAACPVCSPTRASLMTGRHPVRVDITDWIKGRKTSTVKNPRFQHVHDRDELALEERTIAEELAEHGYQTCFAGKWHLGGDGFLPTDQGFDVNIGGFHVGAPPGGYYSPWKNPYLKSRRKGEYLTQRLTDDSIQFIRERDGQRPFFLYLSYYNVHTPIQPDNRSVEEYRSKAKQLGPSPTAITERNADTRARQDNPEYASMVGAVDRSVGEVLRALDELGLSDNTVVCFFSDNGGLSTLPAGRRQGPTSNLPLRAGKGWLYEGGIREPMIVRAPGTTTPGSVSDDVVCSMDFYPTLLQLVGLPLQTDRHCDGVSLMPILDGSGRLPERSLYWHYPHYHGSAWTPGAAMRDGRWKLIEFYETDEVELYDMESDRGEQRDVSEQHSARLATMRKKLRTWQEQMQARMPEPNLNWKPATN